LVKTPKNKVPDNGRSASTRAIEKLNLGIVKDDVTVPYIFRNNADYDRLLEWTLQVPEERNPIKMTELADELGLKDCAKLYR